MHKAIAINDFQHGRQVIRSGDTVYFDEVHVAEMELRGLIEKGSAEKIDDMTEEQAEYEFQAEFRRKKEEDRLNEQKRIEDERQEKLAEQHQNKMEVPPANKAVVKAAAPAAAAARKK